MSYPRVWLIALIVLMFAPAALADEGAIEGTPDGEPPVEGEGEALEYPRIVWDQATAASPWDGRRRPEAITVGEKVLIIAGGDGFGDPVYNDIWSTTDGTNWVQETASAAFAPRERHAVVEFGEGFLLMAGRERRNDFADVWESTDGVNWTLVTDNPAWPARRTPGVVVYNGSLYLMGGRNQQSLGYLNDVWKSEDGETWTQVVADAPWSNRTPGEVVVYDGYIWLLGGYNGRDHLGDVWRTTDGVDWEMVGAGYPWGNRTGMRVLTYQGRLWMFGGVSDRALGDKNAIPFMDEKGVVAFHRNDVWVTTDGIDWTFVPESDWSARAGHEVFVLDDVMWLIAGFDGNNNLNDVYRGIYLEEPLPMEGEGDLEEPGEEERVSEGLLALYTFEEGDGSWVYDFSGTGEPLDLFIVEPEAAIWDDGALVLDEPNIIMSVTPADKITNAVKESEEITIEAWVKTDEALQSGPARLVSVSKNTQQRNVTMGQDGSELIVRLRNGFDNPNGVNAIESNSFVFDEGLHHLVYTRYANGTEVLYKDFVVEAIRDVPGELSAWDDSFRLALGNEVTGTRPWLGEFHMVAIYDQALSPREVRRNFFASPEVITLPGGPGSVEPRRHTADTNQDGALALDELLRIVQLYNSGGFHCAGTSNPSEDGYLPFPGADETCRPHSSDYQEINWDISLSELLRNVQLYAIGGHVPCVEDEDGFCTEAK